MEKFFALSNEKQNTIRNAALACFAKHGYEKASINDIAVAAGISKASIFQYFGSKQALYQYLLDYCTAQMKQAYDANTLEENTDFFDRVWEASVMKVGNLKQHPHIGSFIASAAVTRTEIKGGTAFSGKYKICRSIGLARRRLQEIQTSRGRKADVSDAYDACAGDGRSVGKRGRL